MFWRKKTPPASGPASGGAGASSGGSAGPSAGGSSGASAQTPSAIVRATESGIDRKRFEALLTSIAQVSQTLDLEELLTHIVDSSVDYTGAERGLLILCDEKGELEVRVARARDKKPFVGAPRFARSIVRKVIDTHQPVRATVSSDSEAADMGSSFVDLKLRAMMCVPLIARAREGGEKERGALYVDSKAATREFKAEDLELFQALGQHISISLENARLHVASLEKARMEESLEIAQQIQKGLMPQIPENVPGYDLHGWYQPAERTTGDFFDFVRTRDGRLGVVLGDVAGHGIGPALITATAQAQLRAYLKMMDDPGAIVTLVNQDLASRMDDSRFLTLFVAVLAPDGTLSALNAGQTPPLLWRAKTKTIETLRRDGPALGMVADHEYEGAKRVQLEPGDVLLVLTDGFVEARSATDPDQLFEEAGVRKVLEPLAASNASARAITEALVQAALSFAGGRREDDMTVVAVRRTA